MGGVYLAKWNVCWETDFCWDFWCPHPHLVKLHPQCICIAVREPGFSVNESHSSQSWVCPSVCLCLGCGRPADWKNGLEYSPAALGEGRTCHSWARPLSAQRTLKSGWWPQLDLDMEPSACSPPERPRRETRLTYFCCRRPHGEAGKRQVQKLRDSRGCLPSQVSVNCCVMFLIPGHSVLRVSQELPEVIWSLLN